jgi:hypothetical protein
LPSWPLQRKAEPRLPIRPALTCAERSPAHTWDASDPAKFNRIRLALDSFVQVGAAPPEITTPFKRDSLDPRSFSIFTDAHGTEPSTRG